MGNRRKFLYKEGLLLDALTGEVVRNWHVISEKICPSEYSVELMVPDGKSIVITEDEKGIWLDEAGRRIYLSGGYLKLPSFEGHDQKPLLRALHHEILVNIVQGKPFPNIFVYSNPWYRDAAMMCMCLEKTGNLHLVSDWILGLGEPFDLNNAGNCEPDNLGQALYMISLVSDSSHLLVGTILRTIPRFKRANYIIGMTDGTEHPVYQTKWLKFGLRCLLLDDPYEIPDIFDSYSSLFWMDYTQDFLDVPCFSKEARELYPYLGWAEAHFHNWTFEMTSTPDKYPLTWEAHASEARYEGMERISKEFVERRICAPHAWHAAEMFLYLLDPER